MNSAKFDASGKKLTQKEICVQYTDSFLNSVKIITLRDTNEIFFYRIEKGHFEPAESMIKEMSTRELSEDATRNMVGEIIARMKNLTQIDRAEPPTTLIPLENGLYDISTGKRLEHSKEHLFFQVHPIKYNSESKCPKFLKFLDEITEGDETKKENLLKLIGYTFYRGMPYHHLFLFQGKGRNGKSVLIFVIESLLGKENICSVKLHELAENRFASVELYKKNANLCGELNIDKIKDTANLKDISAGDRVKAEKKFQPPFYFNPYAKLIFSGNELPQIDDKTDAWTDRLIIVDFTAQFIGIKQNHNLKNELTDPEELSGIFNLAMDALDRLLDGEGFETRTLEERRQEYDLHSSSAMSYMASELELAINSETLKSEIYDSYLSYCQSKNKRPATNTSFWTAFKTNYGDSVKEGKSSLKGRPRIIRGIKRKNVQPVQGLSDYSITILSTPSIRVNETLATPDKTSSLPSKVPPYEKRLKIVREIMQFVGYDGKEYGPFPVGTVIDIPEGMANLFLTKGFAEELIVDSIVTEVV